MWFQEFNASYNAALFVRVLPLSLSKDGYSQKKFKFDVSMNNLSSVHVFQYTMRNKYERKTKKE